MTEFKKLTEKGVHYHHVDQNAFLLAPLGDYDRTKILRCVCISDTHLQHEKLTLPPGDVLIHCGDIMQDGESMADLAPFLEWIQKQPFAHKIVIAGNHDRMLDIEQFEGKLPDCSQGRKSLQAVCTYLQDSYVVINGYCFYGSPWTASCLGWGFAMARGGPLAKVWDNLKQCPIPVDVLLTHGPPLGVLDGKRVHTGDADLLKAIYTLPPEPNAASHWNLKPHHHHTEEHPAARTAHTSSISSASSSLDSAAGRSSSISSSSTSSSLTSPDVHADDPNAPSDPPAVTLHHTASSSGSSSSSSPPQSRVKVHVFGHVHEGHGAVSDGTTLFLNAAICNRHGLATHGPTVFDLPRRARESHSQKH